MPVMKTPGVYIEEKNAFGYSVVAVPTAVPAFVGYTEKAELGGQSCAGKPVSIPSLAAFHSIFGHAPHAVFELKEAPGSDARIHAGPTRKGYSVQQVAGRFGLYWAMQLFFLNGGSGCTIVSVGQYGDGKDEEKNRAAIDPEALKAGIAALEQEAEPTMLVVPDAVGLPDAAACIAVQQAMLRHCGLKTRNRVALLDVYDGHQELKDGPIDRFREHLGSEGLDFAAAYYPHLHTSVVDPSSQLGYQNVLGSSALLQMLREDLDLQKAPKMRALVDELSSALDPSVRHPHRVDQQDLTPEQLDKALWAASPAFTAMRNEMAWQLNRLPPSPAIAGILCRVDAEIGVWQAPANVSVAAAVRPAVELTDEDQASLNVTPGGKSVNALRSFNGPEGVVVWGARTLDGNSLDFRYLHVRRTVILLEESCRLAVRAYALAPNEPSTWATIRSMLEDFLKGIHAQGGLAGPQAEDAFSVQVGLGQTMTPQDILEGLLRVTVLVAVTRPAEFIEITIVQKMSTPGPG